MGVEKTMYTEWYNVLNDFQAFAKKLIARRKYTMVAYPFVSTLLCLNEQNVFLTNFMPHLDALLKLFNQRVPILIFQAYNNLSSIVISKQD